MSSAENRIQFVVSGPFLLLLLLSGGCMVAGFWLYTHPPPPQPVIGPPYFITRVATAYRACFSCVAADGTLKPQTLWKLGKTTAIPETERWWFSPVDRSAEAIAVDRVPMLAVHPAIKNDAPWEGFDQRRVLLVVFQDMEPKHQIEHIVPTPPPCAPAQLEPAKPLTETAPAQDPPKPEEAKPDPAKQQ